MTETSDWATVTAISDGAHFSGTSEVGTVLDLLDQLDVAGAVVTPIIDGEVWFEAEAELSTTTPAWMSIDAAQSPDTGHHAYWQIKRVQVIADDGATFDMPFRAVNYIADLNILYQAALPRYARTVADIHLADIVDVHGGPLTVRMRWHLVPAFDTSTPGAGLVCEFNGLAVRSVDLPDVDADVTLDGPEWAPALIVEDTSDTTGPSTPRALHVTVTDPDGTVLVEDVAVWDAGGLGWQYDGVLEPGIEWTVAYEVEFDDFATLRRSLTGSTTCEPSVGSAGTLTVVADQADYSATIDYADTNGRVERSDGFDGWEVVSPGGEGAAAIADLVDYPPLNTAVTYRAWHGVDGTPSAGVFDTGSDLSAIDESDEITIAAAGWVLTDADTGTHLLLPVSAISEDRESTTVQNTGATAASVTRGFITSPIYAGAVTLVNTTARRDLYALLAAERLLLRGPHGQRDWVAVVGRISESNTTARTSPSPSTGPGAAAPTAYMSTAQFTLAVDTSQP